MLNEDYKDMLQSLADEDVKFLLVGAYALAAHGYPRATMDIDLWVMPALVKYFQPCMRNEITGAIGVLNRENFVLHSMDDQCWLLH